MAIEFINFLRSYIDRGIEYDSFIKPIEHQQDLVDTISFFHPNDDRILFGVNSFNSKEDYITFALGHISTNPQRKEQSYLLQNLYVYKGNDNLGKVDKEKPNYNIASSRLFFEQIIESCNSIRHAIQNHDRATPQLFYIDSDRGVGKTFFLNHFFTQYNDELCDNGILWVRIDLDKQAFSKQTNLEKYINNKLIKIILKYYCRYPKYNFDFFIKQVKLEINKAELDEDIKNNVLRNFNRYVNLFHNLGEDAEISEDIFDPILVDIAYSVLTQKEIKIIYLIDNIDLLDKSENRIEKLNYFLQQIKETFISNLCNKGVFIITYRNSLHNHITKTINASAKVYSPHYKKLEFIDFEKIFNTKIDVIKRRVNVLGQSNTRKWDLSDWPDHLNQFLLFLEEISESKSMEEFLEYIEKSYCNNNRSKTQIIQLLYFAFILNYKNKGKYKLIEYLTLVGHRFPPLVFHYASQNRRLILIKTEKIYDNIFVPNLFCYPYAKDSEYLSIPYSKSYILVKVRLIQVLIGFFEIDFNFESEIPIVDITTYLNIIYNYDKKVVLHCLDEFCELEFIQLNKDNGNFTASVDTTINLKPKFFNFLFGSLKKATDNINLVPLLNTKFYSDIAFFNLCSMRILVSKESLSRKYPLFLTMPYDIIEKNPENYLQWVKCKIINSINLFKFIKEVELFENTNCNNTNGLNNSLIVIHKKQIGISKNLIIALLKQIEIILNSLNGIDRDNLTAEITKHITDNIENK